MTGRTRDGYGDGRAALWSTSLATMAAGRVSRRIGGALAAKLWFTPWRVGGSAQAEDRERDWIAPTRPSTFDVGQTRLRGWSIGGGSTVLLVHGWGDRAASLGALIDPLVTAGFRVVGVDLPGHGASPRGATDLYSMAAAVRAVAGQVGAGAVVAHSMGGPITLLAMREGMGAYALAFIAPAVRLEHALEPFRRTFRVPDRAMEGLRERIEDRFGHDVWHDVAADRFVGAIDVPTLVVHDEDDRQVDHADARLLVDAWPTAGLLTTSGLGHARILREPQVLDRVVSFLATQVDVRHDPRTHGGQHTDVATARGDAG